MSAFVLKLIAIIAMLIDHIGYLMGTVPNTSPALQTLAFLCRMVGRIAFPIFAFQIAQGYRKTSNVYKYGLRLLILAVVSQIPYALFRNANIIGDAGVSLSGFAPNNWLPIIYASFLKSPLNIVFTLFIGLYAIFAFDRLGSFPRIERENGPSKWYSFLGQLLRVGVAFVLCYAATFLGSEYGIWGALLMVAFYAADKRKPLIIISLLAYAVVYTLSCLNVLPHNLLYMYINGFSLETLKVPSINTIMFWFGGILAIVPILFYNPEKRGFKCKWLTYAFYTVHLEVLTILYSIITA